MSEMEEPVIFKYTDYYNAFKGVCPHCAREIIVEPPDISSDEPINIECPLCQRSFLVEWRW